MLQKYYILEIWPDLRFWRQAEVLLFLMKFCTFIVLYKSFEYEIPKHSNKNHPPGSSADILFFQ
jgi:hypothetical protein